MRVHVWTRNRMHQSAIVLVRCVPGSSTDDPPFWKSSRRRPWGRGWSDLRVMSRTAITSKFKMCWFPNEGRYWAGTLKTGIDLLPLRSDQEKTFSGSLVLDLRIWWRHVHTLYCYFYCYAPFPSYPSVKLLLSNRKVQLQDKMTRASPFVYLFPFYF